MRRTMIRIFTCMMLFAICLLIPYAAQAASLGDLLNLSTTELVSGTNQGGISSIEVHNGAAEVTFASFENATLVVELYADDDLADAQGNPATMISRQSAAVMGSSQNQMVSVPVNQRGHAYFVVVAYLQDSSGRRIGDPFEEYLYTEEIQNVINMTVSQLENDPAVRHRFIKLYESDGNSGFALLKEDCTIIRTQSSNSTISVMPGDNNELRIVSASNGIPNGFSGLKAGDTVCIIEDDKPLFDMRNYSYSNSKGANAADYRQFHFVLLKEDPRQEGNALVLTHDEANAGSNDFLEILDIEEEFHIGEIPFDIPILLGSVKGTADLTGILEIHVAATKASCAVKVKYDIPDCALRISAALTTTIPVEVVPVGIPGVASIDITFGILLSCAGALEIDFELEGTVGAKATYRPLFFFKPVSFSNASSLPSAELTDLIVDGEFFVGPAISASVDLLSVFELGVEVAAGAALSGRFNENEWLDDAHEQWHACGGFKCLQGNISLKTFVDVYFKATLLTKSVELASLSAELTEYHRSKTFGTSGFSSCPNIGYLTKVEVWEYGEKPEMIRPVEVSCDNPLEHYESKSRNVNGENPAWLYLPVSPGHEYAVNASWTDPKTGRTISGRDYMTKEKPEVDTVTIVMEIKQYTLTFNDVGAPLLEGKIPDPITVFRGDLVEIPDVVLVKPGYEFVGWSDDEILRPSSELYHPGDRFRLVNDMDLYAIFFSLDDQFYVAYDARAGTGAPQTQQFTRGDQDARISDTVPTRDGFAFVGWSADPDGRGHRYWPGDLIPITEQQAYIRLYAIWTTDYEQFYVTYDAQGGTGAPQAQEFIKGDLNAKISDIVPTRDGFVFAGWSVEPNGSVPSYQPGDRIPNAEQQGDIHLYAVWETAPTQTYTLRYDAGRGTNAPKEQYAPLGEGMYLSAIRPVLQAHLFRGWSRVAPPYHAPAFYPGSLFPGSDKDVTLYAVWQADYRILSGLENPWLSDNPTDLVITANGIPEDFKMLWIGAKEVPVSAYTLQSADNTVLVVSKDYLRQLGLGKYEVVVEYNDGRSESSVLHVTATHTITFHDTGTPVLEMPEPIRDYHGNTVKIPDTVFNKSGREFWGWSLSENPDPSTLLYHPGDELVIEKDLDLYAVYVNLNYDQFYVTYDARGGTGAPQVQQFTRGDQDAKISDIVPTRAGFTFAGWSADRNGGGPLYQPGDSIPLTDQQAYVRLYAVWGTAPALIYTLHYDAGRGTNAPKAQYAPLDEGMYLSADHPVFQAHLFRGWSRVAPPYHAPAYQPGSWFPGSSTDVTLYAVWQADYRILSGLENPWFIDDPADIVITANGIPADFKALWIDGKKVSRSAYTLKPADNTVIVLSKDYLRQLGFGEYEVIVEYSDGYSEPATLQIASLLPATGDSTQFALYAALAVMSLTGLMAVILHRNRITR